MPQYATSFQYTVSGGTPPYTFSISAGALPPGLTMDANGLVTGELTTSGIYSWTVRAIDSVGLECSITDSMYVLGIAGDPTDGTVGLTYSYALSAINGVGPYVFSLDSGSLPDGLSLAASGLITGIPTTEETQTFIVRVVDANGIEVLGTFDITIAAADPDIGELIVPGFDGNEYILPRVGEHDAAAGIELAIFNNGTWAVRKNTAGVIIGTPLTGSWVSAPAPGVGDDYEVRFVGTHDLIGDVDGPFSEPIDTGFLPLTSDVIEQCNAFASTGAGANHNQMEVKDYVVSFRKVGEVTTVDATIKMTAEASV